MTADEAVGVPQFSPLFGGGPPPCLRTCTPNKGDATTQRWLSADSWRGLATLRRKQSSLSKPSPSQAANLCKASTCFQTRKNYRIGEVPARREAVADDAGDSGH
jgi:hypothetical protein